MRLNTFETQHCPRGNKKRTGFTLVELLMSIAITVVIAGALYFSLGAALESWSFTKDQLALQMVLNEINEDVMVGLADGYGIKDSLEIITAASTRIEYVPLWVDDTHISETRNQEFVLNRKYKAGTGRLVTDVFFPEAETSRIVRAAIKDEKDSQVSRIRLLEAVPTGSSLRFVYHPDATVSPDAIKAVWWVNEDKAIYSEYNDELVEISDNPFGVEITGFTLKYFDNANNLITESGHVDSRDIVAATGVELHLEARLNNYKKSLLSFMSMRNAPMRSGHIVLKKDMRVPVPDSNTIHTLLIDNIYGVDNEDVLEIEAVPRSGKRWLIKIVFGRAGFSEPVIKRYTVEYPPGQKRLTLYPGTAAGLGLDLMMIDPSGRYDYDDDEDIDDVVLLEEDVTLIVREMDIDDAGMFIRP